MKLHIGGIEPKEGWTILNIQPGPHTDLVGSFEDLSQLESGSVSEVYASHVLEHVAHQDVLPALQGVHRILVPGGKFFVSVPDLAVLCHFFSSPYAPQAHKSQALGMIFGGQKDAYDFHKTGFDEFRLAVFLRHAGFATARRVSSFGLFQDASEYRPFGFPISLNMTAEKAVA